MAAAESSPRLGEAIRARAFKGLFLKFSHGRV
jgi:hypothetical protein